MLKRERKSWTDAGSQKWWWHDQLAVTCRILGDASDEIMTEYSSDQETNDELAEIIVLYLCHVRKCKID